MKNIEVKSSEPKIIADRICMPSPMDSVRAGMRFFLVQEHIRTMERYFMSQYGNTMNEWTAHAI